MAVPASILEVIRSGDVAHVESLLESDPSLLRVQGEDNWTPLHCASHCGDASLVQTILDYGASPKARTSKDGATPMHLAALQGHTEVVRLLIDYGADVNAADDLHRRGPLGWAVMFDETHWETADVLIDGGANIDIFAAVALGRGENVVNLVKLSKERATSHDFALSLTKRNGVRLLIRIDPNVLSARMSRSHDGKLPLHFAVEKDLPEMVELLLACGADREGKTFSGRTALCLAAERKAAGMVDLLLAKGAKVDARAATALGQMERGSRLMEDAPVFSVWFDKVHPAFTAAR